MMLLSDVIYAIYNFIEKQRYYRYNEDVKVLFNYNDYFNIIRQVIKNNITDRELEIYRDGFNSRCMSYADFKYYLLFYSEHSNNRSCRGFRVDQGSILILSRPICELKIYTENERIIKNIIE